MRTILVLLATILAAAASCDNGSGGTGAAVEFCTLLLTCPPGELEEQACLAQSSRADCIAKCEQEIQEEKTRCPGQVRDAMDAFMACVVAGGCNTGDSCMQFEDELDRLKAEFPCDARCEGDDCERDCNEGDCVVPSSQVQLHLTVLGNVSPGQDSKLRLEVVVGHQPGAEVAFEGPVGPITADVQAQVPATGDDVVLTLLGYIAGSGGPTWFGRVRHASLQPDETLERWLALAPLGTQAGVAKDETGWSDRAFAATTRMPDGRVLITGGFILPATGPANVLDNPTDQAFLYDPSTGVLAQTGNMNTRRAGHRAVWSQGRVVVLGGTTKVTMGGDVALPISVDGAHSLDTFEVFDPQSGTFTSPAPWEVMKVPRAFHLAAGMGDGSILVVGGGAMPGEDDAYRQAELWAPWEEDGQGGFASQTVQMAAQHNGAGGCIVEITKEGLVRYLLVGGTTGDGVVELYTESSQQRSGILGWAKVLDAPGLPRLYLPSVACLSTNKVLIAGGVVYNPSDQAFGAATSDSWILTIGDDDAVTVTHIDSAGCQPRTLGAAVGSFGGDRVWLIGGFTSAAATLLAGPCVFDEQASALSPLADPVPGRAGLQLERLADDTLLLVGGIGDPATVDHWSKALNVAVLAPLTLPGSSTR